MGKTTMNTHGFVRLAAAVPPVIIADPEKNVIAMADIARQADAQGVKLLLFPELSITGYSCADLFSQTSLQKDALRALEALARQTKDLTTSLVVGLPLLVDDQLFNVAAVIWRGAILGLVPKTYIPTYKEFYEGRWFSPANRLRSKTVVVAGQHIPIGTDLIFDFSRATPNLVLGIEICEDLWMPIAPSSYYAIYGATVLANLSASDAIVSKAEYRRDLGSHQSAKCCAAYLYASCSSAGVENEGESTHDVVYDGHVMIAENGRIISESKRFESVPQLIVSDVDLEHLVRERAVTTSFSQAAEENPRQMRRIDCSAALGDNA